MVIITDIWLFLFNHKVLLTYTVAIQLSSHLYLTIKGIFNCLSIPWIFMLGCQKTRIEIKKKKCYITHFFQFVHCGPKFFLFIFLIFLNLFSAHIFISILLSHTSIYSNCQEKFWCFTMLSCQKNKVLKCKMQHP